MTEDQVLAALRVRFRRPEYFFFQQGEFDGRRMDAWAVGCYRTHEWPLLGFEVKVDRADWLRELAEPSKSDPLFARVDEWYLVTPTKDVVRATEIPQAWGWITVSARGCRIERRPPPRPRVPVDRNTLLRCLFKLEDNMREEHRRAREEIYSTAEEWREKERAEIRDQVRRQEAGAGEELERLRKRLELFESVSGIEIDSWSIGDVAKAVAALMHGGLRSSWEYQERYAVNLLKNIREVLAALPPSEPSEEAGG